MHTGRILILAAALVIVLSAAGCTTLSSLSPAPAAPKTTVTAGTALPSLALKTADLPAGWNQTAARAKDPSEISEAAHNAGWQGGYVVTFMNGSAPAGQLQDTIVQTITAYPAASIPGIISVAGAQDRSFSGMTYAEIPVSGLGTSAGGFLARVNTAATVVPTTSAAMNVGVLEVQKPTGPGQNFAEVYFTKGTTFEVIRMTGPHADGDAVLKLAQMAYSKIP